MSALFPKLCQAKGLPAPVAEHVFALPRRWRFDWAWPQQLVALEVEGGVWRKGGGAHSHPSNITRDIEKYSEAAARGWLIVRAVPEKLCTPSTFDYLQRAMKARAA